MHAGINVTTGITVTSGLAKASNNEVLVLKVGNFYLRDGMMQHLNGQ